MAKPKILVIGDARHGKDTVAEILCIRHGFSFKSSSRFAASAIIMPAFGPHYYASEEKCYEDRVNHRELWFNLIADFNRPDPTRLARAIFAAHDLYVGLRASREFHACRNAGLFDAVVWVDRSKHLPREDRRSMELDPGMADFVIDNNGSLEDLHLEVARLVQGQGWDK